MSQAPRELLLSVFQAALAAADPALCVPPHLPAAPNGRTVVVGAGKASAAMARAVEDHWQGALSGLVITRYGHAVPCSRIEIVEAAHPVPDDAGRQAAARIADMVRGLSADDLVLCLISGGGSALLSLPAPGLSLEDKQAVNRALLKCGATISEMNCLRKHLSAIKGGRLAAAAAPARTVSLLISDVPGDDPSIIASGPTVPDPSSSADALAVLEKYAIEVPEAVVAHLRGGRDETPKPGDPRLAGAEAVLIASPQGSLEAAARAAREAGVTPYILGDRIEGEARQVAEIHARGGRNAEFLLALTVALDGAPGIHAIACDTDGIDGTEDNAGALAGPDSLARAEGLGLDARARLADNDGYGFFEALGDLVKTGPTLTNVNDFRAILVEG
jgi:hydroxypyruvate reductase